VALMLAVRNPDLRCVLAVAGPTDLPALQSNRDETAYRLAVEAFGSSRLAALSPVRYASAIKAKLMLVYARNDPIVPVAQGVDLHRAVRGSTLIVLAPGPAPYVHTGVRVAASRSGVSEADKQAAGRAEVQFLLRETAPG
jgi:pimeloyl-ACP methyl ester carboxylesterase